MSIPQSESDLVPFRQRILRLKFHELDTGDRVWVEIRPEYEKMYDSGMRFLVGQVASTPKDGEPDQTVVVVRTALGHWSFRENGLSVAGIATLSVPSSRHGERLCLYEPIEPMPIER